MGVLAEAFSSSKRDPDLEARLREWASAHSEAGYTQAREVLTLLEEVGTLWTVLGESARFVMSLAARVADQSEILSRRACQRQNHSLYSSDCRE